MITKVEIQHFQCIRELTVALSPLTAFVGANGTGKSAVLDALKPEKQLSHTIAWRHDPEKRVRVSFSFENGSTYTCSSHEQPRGEPFNHLSLRVDLMRARKPNEVQRATRLQADGSNLTNIIDSLTRDQQDGLAASLCQLVPQFRDVDARPAANQGKNTLLFQDRWDPAIWFHPHEVSDGTILMLAFLTLRYMDPPVDLLTLEEPERGLHPYLLQQLVALLRDLSTGKLSAKPIQVVLATHSPELLDCLAPEDVRFLRRSEEDGSTVVETAPMTSETWDRYFQEYQRSLGSAWLSGGLGGVPGAA